MACCLFFVYPHEAIHPGDAGHIKGSPIMRHQGSASGKYANEEKNAALRKRSGSPACIHIVICSCCLRIQDRGDATYAERCVSIQVPIEKDSYWTETTVLVGLKKNSHLRCRVACQCQCQCRIRRCGVTTMILVISEKQWKAPKVEVLVIQSNTDANRSLILKAMFISRSNLFDF